MSATNATPSSGFKTTPSVAKIVGTPTNSAWAQIHTFVPTEPETQKTHGELLAAISLELQDTTDSKAVDIGHEILQRLQEEYFGKKFTGSPLEHLKLSIETTVSQFTVGANIEIVASVLWQNFVYFCAWGGGNILVWRNGKLATILTARQGMSGTSSGKLEDKDIFILGTDSFFKLISKEKIVLALEKNPQVQIVDDFASLVHETSNPTLSGLVFSAVIENEIVEDLNDEPLTIRAKEDLVSKPIIQAQAIENIHEEVRPELYTGGTTIKMNQNSFFKKLLVKFAQILPDKDIHSVKPHGPSSRKTAISVGILLLVLLGASIIFGAVQKKSVDLKNSYADRLNTAQKAFDDALMQKDISPPHAKELFKQSQDIINIILAQGIVDENVNALKEKLDQNSGLILGKVMSQASLFIDLALVRSNISASEINIDKNEISILDSKGARVITVGVSDKSTDAVGGVDKINGAKSFARGDQFYVLGSEGVYKLSSKGAVSTIIKTDDEWGDIPKIAFFGSNLYLLDKNNGIWRYSATTEGFGSKTAWLKDTVDFNFSDVVDISIDGSLWIMSRDGTIQKFTRGAKDSFNLSGLDLNFTANAFYTDEKLENIYILDSGNKRIIEVAKNGTFKKQFEAEQIGAGVDLVVSKDAGKIFLLTPDKVFALDLQ